MVAAQGKQRHEEIAQGNALQHGPQPQVAEAEQVALDGVVEPVEEQADGKEQHRALHHLQQHGSRGRETTLAERDVARDTHDEQEEGEH